jgi:hypothetical protein
MKQLLSYGKAVLALTLTFALLTSFVNVETAAVVTGSLTVYSAAMHMGAFSGVLFNAPPTIPDFTEKSFDEIQAMSAEEHYKYRKAENEFHSASTEKAIYDSIQGLKAEIKNASDEEKEALKENVKAAEAKLDELRKENIKFGLEIKSIHEKGGKFVAEATTAFKELSENMDKIKEIAKGRTTDEVEIKALTLRSAVQGDEGAVDLNTVGQYGRVTLSMWDLFPKITLPNGTNQGQIRYYDWDEASTVEAAEMVAEGAAYPESTAKWQKYTIDLKKIGDTLPVTEEFFEDEALFAAEIRMFLMRNVEDIMDYQIARGAGTGENLTGLQTTATAFTPAAVAHYDTPNIFDLLCAMKEQVTKTRGSKYRPNFVAMNKTTMNKMFGEKDGDKNYLKHPLLAPNMSSFDGMTFVEANILENDVIIIGDNRYGVIYHKPGITLSRGYSGTQFVEDEITLKVRKRCLFLIRNVDASSFIKVTDIDAALAAIDETS